MGEAMFKKEGLMDEVVKTLQKRDVAAVSYSAGGAMGAAGEVSVYYYRDSGIICASGSWVLKQVNAKLLDRRIHCFGGKDKGWTEFYMGCGHSLYVNSSDYPILAEKFEGLYEDEVGMMHMEAVYDSLFLLIEKQGG